MKKTILGKLILAAMFVSAGVVHFAFGEPPPGGYPKPPFPMPELSAPVFPDQNFNITNYGAVADGKIKNTAAFAKTIATCNQAGGGHVIVPAGMWLTGPIIFKSGVDLHLEKGAIISFSSDPVDYAPSVFGRLGKARVGLICNNGGNNIALTGEGELIGNGAPWWKPVQEKIDEKHRLKQKMDPRVSTVPSSYSFIDPGTGKRATIGRPTFVSFNNSSNVLIEGVTLRDGPIFMVHPNRCENVIIRNIQVYSFGGPNTDGIDPAACKNVLIDNCFLDTGDDCLVIKSSDGHPAENIVIRNLKTKRGHGGIVIGSTVEGGVRNVFGYNCDFDGTETGIRIKSNRSCGGVVENLWFQDIRMGTILDQAIILDMRYHDRGMTLPPDANTMPVFRNIHIKNVTCRHAREAMQLVGLPESPIHDVTLDNITLHASRGVTEISTQAITKNNVIIEAPDSKP